MKPYYVSLRQKTSWRIFQAVAGFIAGMISLMLLLIAFTEPEFLLVLVVYVVASLVLYWVIRRLAVYVAFNK